MSSSTRTYVVLNDLQIPFHDRRVLDHLVLPFVRELRPDGVVLNGDIADCYSISEFDKNPLTRATLSTEIALTHKLLEKLEWIAEKHFIAGNHEDRLRRLVWKNPQLLGVVDGKTRETLVRALDFDTMFGLGEHGFSYRPYGEYLMLGKLLVTHGSTVRRHSGDTARAHLVKYGTSVLIGHTHRMGVSYRTDIRGVHAGYENGCLCSLKPEYVQHPNWQTGFSVVHVAHGGMFSVQQIPILGRRLFFWGSDQHGLTRAA